MTQILYIAMLLIGVLVSMATAAADTVTADFADPSDICSKNSDGCSIPDHLPFFYKQLFTSACYKHDQCYSCGAMYGKSRLDCDTAFHINTKQSCKDTHDNLITRNTCYEFSTIYFESVREFAETHFASHLPSDNYCAEPWVAGCLGNRTLAGHPNKEGNFHKVNVKKNLRGDVKSLRLKPSKLKNIKL